MWPLRSPRPTRAGATVLAVALLVAACDGDGDGDGDDPPASTGTTAPRADAPSPTPVTGVGRPDPRVPVGAPATVLVVPLDVADPAGGWFITTDLPRLEGLADPAVEARVDEALATTLADLVASWQDRFVGRTRDGDGGPTASLVATFEVRAFDERVLSLWFDVRATDGTERHTVALTASFDLRDGTPLELGDVLADGERPWVEVVSELATARLVERLAPTDADLAGSIAAGASAAPANFASFTLGPTGLSVIFEEFQLGPAELGAPVVELAWAELADVVDPRGPAATFVPPPTTTTTTTTATTTTEPPTTDATGVAPTSTP